MQLYYERMVKELPSSHAPEKPAHPHAGADSHAADRSAHAHREINMGEVGSHDANHAWSQMTGRQTGHGETHPHKTDSVARRENNMNFNIADHGDIYGQGARSSGKAGDSNLGRPETMEGRGMRDTDTHASHYDLRHEENADGRNAALAMSDGRYKVGERGVDRPTVENGLRPPDVYTPTPEQLANDPVEKLQKMVQDNRDAQLGYIKRNGDNIPQIATHGTDKRGGESISNRLQGDRMIWAAGQDPSRGAANDDPNNKLGDISTAAGYSGDFARGTKAGQNGQGPIHVLDVSGDKDGFNRTPNKAEGSRTDGTSARDLAKFGEFDTNKVKVIATVPAEKLGKINDQYGKLDEALIAKQQAQLKQPGGTNAAEIADIDARVQIMRDNKALAQTQAILDALAVRGDANPN